MPEQVRVEEHQSRFGPWISVYRGNEKVFSWSKREIYDSGAGAIAIMLAAVLGVEVKAEVAASAAEGAEETCLE